MQIIGYTSDGKYICVIKRDEYEDYYGDSKDQIKENRIYKEWERKFKNGINNLGLDVGTRNMIFRSICNDNTLYIDGYDNYIEFGDWIKLVFYEFQPYFVKDNIRNFGDKRYKMLLEAIEKKL